MTRLSLLTSMAALVLLGPWAACARAAEELGPNDQAVPGLASTVVAPEFGGPPLRVGLYYDFANLDEEHGQVGEVGLPDLHSRNLRLQLSVRAARNVVIGASMPWRWISADGGPSESGPGDLRVAGSARLWSNERWRLGVWGGMSLPSGDETKGLSSERVEGEYGLHSSVIFFRDANPPEMRWHFNLGYRLNKRETEGYGVYSGDPLRSGVFPPSYPGLDGDADRRDNDHVVVRSAVEFRRRWGHLFVEAAWDWLAWYDEAKTQESAAWLTPGVYLGKDDGIALKAAWAIQLGADDAATEFVPSLPDWHFQVGLSMPIFLGGRDSDGDGIPDSEDACPQEPEDLDGYEDTDGCPDVDNDLDGIEDRYDLAPNLPEDFDGFEDDDGRPERDNDLDGIVDERDACPNRPEDFDGDRDEDGCPDLVVDRDGDGIADERDTCPLEPEDFDGFEDGDGCPDLDNDLDGIPDDADACPLEAEDYDGVDDEDGCPDPPSSASGSR